MRRILPSSDAEVLRVAARAVLVARRRRRRRCRCRAGCRGRTAAGRRCGWPRGRPWQHERARSSRVRRGRRSRARYSTIALSPSLVGVVDVEAPAAARSRARRPSTAGPARRRRGPAADVEERLRQLLAVAHDADRARPARRRTGGGCRRAARSRRRVERTTHLHQPHAALGLRGRRGRVDVDDAVAPADEGARWRTYRRGVPEPHPASATPTNRASAARRAVMGRGRCHAGGGRRDAGRAERPGVCASRGRAPAPGERKRRGGSGAPGTPPQPRVRRLP